MNCNMKTKIPILLCFIVMTGCSTNVIINKTKIDSKYYTVVKELMPITVDDYLYLYRSDDGFYDELFTSQIKLIEAIHGDSIYIKEIDEDNIRIYIYRNGYKWVEPKTKLNITLKEYTDSLPLRPVDSLDLGNYYNGDVFYWKGLRETWYHKQ